MSALPRWLTTKTFYKHFRYQVTLHSQTRDSWQTITQFFRLPVQFQVLSGTVVDFFKSEINSRALRITVIGCSTGEEVYSIIASLTGRHPTLEFHVNAYDIKEDVLEQARDGHYKIDKVNKSAFPAELRSTCLKLTDDCYVIDERLKQYASFARADILSPSVSQHVEAGDIVFAQNLFFNLERRVARQAFANVVSLMSERSVLFCEGMDLDMRTQLTRQFRLEPLDCEIEPIHEDGRRSRLTGWPYNYWGLEPLSKKRRDWRRRYCTIFVKGRP